MKNFILKNKVKILLTLFFTFLLLTLNNNVFATFTFTHDDVSYTINTLPDDPNFNKDYFSILKSGEDFLILSYIGYNPDTMTIINTNATDGYTGIANSYDGTPSTGRVKLWNYDTSTNRYSMDTWQPNKAFYRYYHGAEMNDKYLYSTVPIYLASGSGDTGTYLISDEIFFQVAPPEEEKPEVPEIPETPEEETPKATTLPEIMEQVEKEAVLKEIVVLLPVILSVLVSLIALRKALKMLLDFLKVS